MALLGAQQRYDVIQADERVDDEAEENGILLELSLVAYQIEHEQDGECAHQHERDRLDNQLEVVLD